MTGHYASPGVYVEEIPSAVRPIAGVGTSTAGFVGVVPNSLTIPVSYAKAATNIEVGTGNGTNKTFDLAQYPVNTATGTFIVRVDGIEQSGVTLTNDSTTQTSSIVFGTTATAPPANKKVTADYVYDYAIKSFTVPTSAGEIKLCTSFADFVKYFGSFSTDAGHTKLAHAVDGFFRNGGTRCFVQRVTTSNGVPGAIADFDAIDEIALVTAPGITTVTYRDQVIQSCRTTGDRFAILDCPETVESSGSLDLTRLAPGGSDLPPYSDYAAFYFPWIQVFDPATKMLDPSSDGFIWVPPSGHVAGIYARVDTTRGVHKAPANETVAGALGLKYQISRNQQDGLNPHGVNAIRDLNGNIRVWGARTLGGDANGEWKYISVRRLFLFLRESIDEGTQWVVFEPNTPALWAKIIRNITAFLTIVWRAGALFGNSPQEAFYVKCDEETNPPEVRDQGRVVTEIGVAVVKPAEFVIFRISQWAGPAG